MNQTQYAAFISYSHADSRWAAWLQSRLERYRVPRHLVGQRGSRGPVPSRLGRCFRDRSELSAGNHLADALKDALRRSRALIVLCSPGAAASEWVNQEIAYFRSLGREQSIFALVVDGEPGEGGRRCWPSALLFDAQGQPIEEPLAADARHTGDGRDDAFLKLVAGMIGVGFDDLRRREHHRRARVLTGMLGAAASIATLTSVLAFVAVQARDEATTRRQQADDLIGFMLGDLKGEIEKIGRLDVMDATVAKTFAYLHDAGDGDDHPAALGRRIEALVAISEIRYARNEVDDAIAAARDAVAGAKRLVQIQDSARSRFRLADALYALAEPLLEAGDYAEAGPLSLEAHALTTRLLAERAEDADLAYLRARLDDQLGYFHLNNPQGDVAAALRHWDDCVARMHDHATRPGADSRLTRFWVRCHIGRAEVLAIEHNQTQVYADLVGVIEQAMARHPRDQALRYLGLVGSSNASRMLVRMQQLDEAAVASRLAMNLAEQLVRFDPQNMSWRRWLAAAYRSDAELMQASGDLDRAWTRADDAQQAIESLIVDDPQSALVRDDSLQLRRLRASLLVQRDGSRVQALAELAQGAALIAPDLQPGRSMERATMLRLQQWLYAGRDDSGMAALAKRESETFLAQLRGRSAELTIEDLEARFAYCDGDLEQAERKRLRLVSERYHLVNELEEFRRLSCAMPGAPAACATQLARQ
jgi:eukaryotic-like serine/threonine-protein kinase